MSFPRYPKYKASGVEWLGDVPAGWEVKRSDSFLSYSRAQLDPKDFQGLEVFHYSIPVVQETGTGQLENGAEIASGKQIVSRKVVLVSKLNPRKGTICIAEPQQALTLCSTEFVALEPNGCDIHFLSYLVRNEGFRQGLESKVTSVTNSHQRANPVDIYRFWNAWPPLPEQTAIAEFLDRETGKIDELVAEQRRLMELLKEKRQAVISHAVTKGLNPHAPMKPSGIEWLGDVPEHWEVKPLKFVATYNDDVIDETTPPDTEILYVDISAVDALDGIKMKEPMAFSAAPSRARRRVKHGDTIISTVRTYLRAIARVRMPEENLIVSTGFAVIRPRANLSPDYVGNVVSASYFIEQVIARSTGVGYPAINASDLARIPVPLPPLAEQTAIAEFLDTELAKFDTLTAEAQCAIDLLQERRTALISAAVTGQIDVHQQPRN